MLILIDLIAFFSFKYVVLAKVDGKFNATLPLTLSHSLSLRTPLLKCHYSDTGCLVTLVPQTPMSQERHMNLTSLAKQICSQQSTS
jgi:hypothetical protein